MVAVKDAGDGVGWDEDLASEGVADALLGNPTGVAAEVVEGAEDVVGAADEVIRSASVLRPPNRFGSTHPRQRPFASARMCTRNA
jgi:hypothetical protein